MRTREPENRRIWEQEKKYQENKKTIEQENFSV